MYELILALASVSFTVVTVGVLIAVVDYFRWKAREQASDLLVKIVDRQRHSLFISKGMLAELLTSGEIVKYRDGRRWVKVGHA